MSRGGQRDGAGRIPRRKHGILAGAAGRLNRCSLMLYAIALRDGRLPRRQLGELSREILREAMSARREIERALRR